MATLLSLPPELLEYIMAHALHFDAEDFVKYPVAKKSPRTKLLRLFYPALACKTLYSIALPGYFRYTQLDVVVRRPWDAALPSTKSMTYRSDLDASQPIVLLGEFEEHPLFFENATKLRVQVDELTDESCKKVRDILLKCGEVVEIAVCLLRPQHREPFFNWVKEIVDDIKKTANRNIKVWEESSDVHNRILEQHFKALLLRRDREADRSLRRSHVDVPISCELH